CQHYYDSPYSF
nr:immunoglobulin light chain junction region [Macaca mulatta]